MLRSQKQKRLVQKRESWFELNLFLILYPWRPFSKSKNIEGSISTTSSFLSHFLIVRKKPTECLYMAFFKQYNTMHNLIKWGEISPSRRLLQPPIMPDVDAVRLMFSSNHYCYYFEIFHHLKILSGPFSCNITPPTTPPPLRQPPKYENIFRN